MPKNQVKAALKEGRWVSGLIVEEIRSVGPVKILANAGHDFLWFDMEHNFIGWETLHNLVQFSLAIGITPLVRVTDLSYPAVARALDTGAQGIIIPRVENREQTEEAVNFAKYPPRGRRGSGGMARNVYEAKDVKSSVIDGDAETMVIVQIESPRGVDNLDDIASVDGLDVVCVGPQDLSINLGVHGKFDDPAFVDTVRKINDICSKHDIATGMVSRDASSFKLWHRLGCRFLVCNSDLSLIFPSASRDKQTLRDVLGS
jgi:4-hydroxy-2-oxoheptanedioate aldolase